MADSPPVQPPPPGPPPPGHGPPAAGYVVAAAGGDGNRQCSFPGPLGIRSELIVPFLLVIFQFMAIHMPHIEMDLAPGRVRRGGVLHGEANGAPYERGIQC